MATQAVAIDLARSAERIERDIETLAGADYTLSDEAIRRYAYTQEYRNTLDYFTRELREIGFEVYEDPGRDARRAQPAARRAGLRRRLSLRLEPQRRQVRRHDGRRHRARGLPPERGARPRPAAPAHLLPRGGRLRLRANAARQPDHAPAGDRGGAARVVPCDRRRPKLLGARGGGRLRAGAVAGVHRRARRPRGLDRDAHRAGPRAAGHRQPHRHRHRDRRLRARGRGRPRSRRPRRRDADGLPPRPDAADGRDDRRARAARARGGEGNGGNRRRDRGRPGDHQRDREPRPLLARHPRPGRRRVSWGRSRHRSLRRGGGGPARHGGRVLTAPDPARNAARRPDPRRARGRGEGDRASRT